MPEFISVHTAHSVIHNITTSHWKFNTGSKVSHNCYGWSGADKNVKHTWTIDFDMVYTDPIRGPGQHSQFSRNVGSVTSDTVNGDFDLTLEKDCTLDLQSNIDALTAGSVVTAVTYGCHCHMELLPGTHTKDDGDINYSQSIP